MMDTDTKITDALNRMRSPVAAGAYRWIEEAAKVLKDADYLAGKSMGLHDRIEELLRGVPVQPEDLGFDSPAPELLEALTFIVASVDEYRQPGAEPDLLVIDPEAIDYARAALKKAIGE